MNEINKHLRKLNKMEKKLLNSKESRISKKLTSLSEKVESKIPKTLNETINTAFYKSFKLIFKSGTRYIEKLYDKNKIKSKHNIFNQPSSGKSTRKSIKLTDKYAIKSSFVNSSISAVEGAGLGLIGMGIPDIPLFTAMILKTVYEISLSYGFSYNLKAEKIYILNLINASLTSSEEKQFYNIRVDEISKNIDNNIEPDYDLEKEMFITSGILTDVMLVPKFIQGIPVAGAVGSLVNLTIISKISKYSRIKYKKRYVKKNFKQQDR